MPHALTVNNDHGKLVITADLHAVYTEGITEVRVFKLSGHIDRAHCTRFEERTFRADNPEAPGMTAQYILRAPNGEVEWESTLEKPDLDRVLASLGVVVGSLGPVTPMVRRMSLSEAMKRVLNPDFQDLTCKYPDWYTICLVDREKRMTHAVIQSDRETVACLDLDDGVWVVKKISDLDIRFLGYADPVSALKWLHRAAVAETASGTQQQGIVEDLEASSFLPLREGDEE